MPPNWPPVTFRHLAVHVVGEPGAEEEHRRRGLLGLGGAAERDDHRGHRPHLLGDPEVDLLAVADLDLLALLLRLRQPGLDEAEGDRVAVDLEPAPLLGERLGEADDAGLGGRVVDLAGVAHRPRDRGDVDDLAEQLLALGLLGLRRLAPVRGDRADDAEGDDRVDVEHRLELLVGHPVDDPVPGVAGVVDDDVDLAEGLDRLRDQLVRHAGLGQVAGEDRGLAVDLARRLLGDVAVDVVDQDLGALVDEQLRRRPADAARRAGDDRRLAVKQSHVLDSLLSITSVGVGPAVQVGALYGVGHGAAPSEIGAAIADGGEHGRANLGQRRALLDVCVERPGRSPGRSIRAGIHSREDDDRDRR